MKDKILDMLETKNDYLSGEVMASSLNMTRANIWKEIQKLRKDGYDIDSASNRGYKLISSGRNISSQAILSSVPYLDQLILLSEVDSTNSYLKKHNFPKNTLMIAHEQTQGRGRRERSFYSPPKSGIYMSLLLHPHLDLQESQLITIISALSICNALEVLYDLSPKIKWLNDIYLDTKKVCGILTEGEIELETNQFKSLVLGIGLNTYRSDTIPHDIENIYTSLDEHTTIKIDKTILITTILNAFYQLYTNLPHNKESIIKSYKSYLNCLNKFIYIKGKPHIIYKVKDISSYGHLIVEDSNLITLELNSGEISILETNS